MKSRPEKLVEAIKQHPAIINEFLQGQPADVFTKYSSEQEIIDTFDAIKDKYGRDVFGQGYIFRLIDDAEIADVDSLTEDEMQNGIDTSKPYYVPYDKGDKDGNRWYLETPFAIAWSKENVRFLKTDPKARFQGSTFFFKEGLCWSEIKTHYIRCRLKEKSINSNKSMAFYPCSNGVSINFIITLLNSSFAADYVNALINNTQTFGIDDARQLPIIIPNAIQMKDFEDIFQMAVTEKRTTNNEESLSAIQEALDMLTLKLYDLY